MVDPDHQAVPGRPHTRHARFAGEQADFTDAVTRAQLAQQPRFRQLGLPGGGGRLGPGL